MSKSTTLTLWSRFMAPIYIERFRDLYAMLAGIPATQIDLRSWRGNDAPHACSTIACVIGWACIYPPFNDQGLFLAYSRAPAYAHPELGDVVIYEWQAVKQFFGVTDYQAEDLFTDLGLSRYRVALGCGRRREGANGNFKYNEPLKHKRYVLARIRQFLLGLGAISARRAVELAAYEATLQ